MLRVLDDRREAIDMELKISRNLPSFLEPIRLQLADPAALFAPEQSDVISSLLELQGSLDHKFELNPPENSASLLDASLLVKSPIAVDYGLRSCSDLYNEEYCQYLEKTLVDIAEQHRNMLLRNCPDWLSSTEEYLPVQLSLALLISSLASTSALQISNLSAKLLILVNTPDQESKLKGAQSSLTSAQQELDAHNRSEENKDQKVEQLKTDKSNAEKELDFHVRNFSTEAKSSEKIIADLARRIKQLESEFKETQQKLQGIVHRKDEELQKYTAKMEAEIATEAENIVKKVKTSTILVFERQRDVICGLSSIFLKRYDRTKSHVANDHEKKSSSDDLLFQLSQALSEDPYILSQSASSSMVTSKLLPWFQKMCIGIARCSGDVGILDETFCRSKPHQLFTDGLAEIQDLQLKLKPFLDRLSAHDHLRRALSQCFERISLGYRATEGILQSWPDFFHFVSCLKKSPVKIDPHTFRNGASELLTHCQNLVGIAQRQDSSEAEVDTCSPLAVQVVFTLCSLYDVVKGVEGAGTYALALINTMKFVIQLILLCFRLILVRRGNFAAMLKKVERQLEDPQIGRIGIQLEQIRSFIPSTEHDILREVGRYESLIPSMSGSLTRYFSQVAFNQISSPFTLCMQISESVQSIGELFAKPSFYMRELLGYLVKVLRSHCDNVNKTGNFPSDECKGSNDVLKALKQFAAGFSFNDDACVQSAKLWYTLRRDVETYIELLIFNRQNLAPLRGIFELLNDLSESMTFAFTALIGRNFAADLSASRPNPKIEYVSPSGALNKSNIRLGALNYFSDLQRYVSQQREDMIKQTLNLHEIDWSTLTQAMLITRSLVVALEDRGKSLHDLVNLTSEQQLSSVDLLKSYSEIVEKSKSFILSTFSEFELSQNKTNLLKELLEVEMNFFKIVGRVEGKQLTIKLANVSAALENFKQIITVVKTQVENWNGHKDKLIETRFEARKWFFTKWIEGLQTKIDDIRKRNAKEAKRFDDEQVVYAENIKKITEVGKFLVSDIHKIAVAEKVFDQRDQKFPFQKIIDELKNDEAEIASNHKAVTTNFLMSRIKDLFKYVIEPRFEVYVRSLKSDCYLNLKIEGDGAFFENETKKLKIDSDGVKKLIDVTNWTSWSIKFVLMRKAWFNDDQLGEMLIHSGQIHNELKKPQAVFHFRGISIFSSRTAKDVLEPIFDSGTSCFLSHQYLKLPNILWFLIVL